MAKETYKGRAWCANCEKEVHMDIPKGTTKKEFFEQTRMCPVCGCMTCGLKED